MRRRPGWLREARRRGRARSCAAGPAVQFAKLENLRDKRYASILPDALTAIRPPRTVGGCAPCSSRGPIYALCCGWALSRRSAHVSRRWRPRFLQREPGDRRGLRRRPNASRAAQGSQIGHHDLARRRGVAHRHLGHEGWRAVCDGLLEGRQGTGCAVQERRRLGHARQQLQLPEGPPAAGVRPALRRAAGRPVPARSPWKQRWCW